MSAPAPGDLDRFTEDELMAMHTVIYHGIQDRFTAIEKIPSWLPSRRIALAAVREQQDHLEAVGGHLRARWDANAAAREGKLPGA